MRIWAYKKDGKILAYTTQELNYIDPLICSYWWNADGTEAKVNDRIPDIPMRIENMYELNESEFPDFIKSESHN